MRNWIKSLEALMILSRFKDNKNMIYSALSKHLSSQNHEKMSQIQSERFDSDEKQNLKKLKYDDNDIHRINTIACNNQFYSVSIPYF
jgi:hypothetical protein